MVNGRKVKYTIPGLEIDREWISKPTLVKKHVYKFFREHFREKFKIRPELECEGIRTVHADLKDSLVAPFSKEEIKSAMFDCGSDKAPGPDGFNFKGVVSESQSAFLKDRFILDGPLIVSELVDWLKKKNKKAFLLKIDFGKAYNNVKWNFLINIMLQMGFPNQWCLWVKGILDSARSAVLVNGSPTFEFNCERGSDKEILCPLFLFLIVMKTLSWMLNKAREIGELPEIRISDMDITLLFLCRRCSYCWRVVSGEFGKIAWVLRCFYLCLGLRINLHKSNLFGIEVEDDEVDDMWAVVGCRRGLFPFDYLGIKVGANMNRIGNWSSIINVVEKRLAS
ncbi:uncharacterized protein LOC143589432 [Bidens hawaiensis]|uniref:uncharacterized protein LOC143589432 n=1 Tax=Bidens hawaiensis TaxID=980011 RepID=UPI00404B965A